MYMCIFLIVCFLSGEGVLEFEILQVFPFDSARKCMSVVLSHPITREKILYCKGADSTILPQLAPSGQFPRVQGSNL
jgi:phospholipid-translocating ATPase